MPKIEIFKCSNTKDYVKHAVHAIEQFILEKLQEKKVVRIALSGGNSPVPVYEALIKIGKINWNRVALFLVDERYVPLNSKESNARMIKELFADKVKIRRFYHLNTRDPIGLITDQYQKTLEQQSGKPLFDLVLLGMGEDGHTASLFPGDKAVHETHRLVTHTHHPDGSGQERITLTFPALLDSEKIFFLIRGSNKMDRVDELLSDRLAFEDFPAAGVLQHPDVTVFYDKS